MHSTSLLYVWGRNDSGQLGLGPEAPFLSHTIQEIQCEIPFSVPTHYASLKKISCGSNFVVATVHSSAFPLFLWGAFKIFDPVQTSFETNPSRIFLSLNKKKPTSNKTSLYPIDQSFKIMSIMKPTPVLSEFWENSCIDDVTCGHSSSVQVMK
jgi:alpha-tubulin suppressor-like RCC1 family protein